MAGDNGGKALTGLRTPSIGYKPFRYPWAYEFWRRQQQVHGHHRPAAVPAVDERARGRRPVGLERADRRRMLDMVGERTVIFSTHITSDLERVADRVAVLKALRERVLERNYINNLLESIAREMDGSPHQSA